MRSFFSALKKRRDKKETLALLLCLGTIVFITATTVVLLMRHPQGNLPLTVLAGVLLLLIAVGIPKDGEEWFAVGLVTVLIFLCPCPIGAPCLIWYFCLKKKALLALGAALLCTAPALLAFSGVIAIADGFFFSLTLSKIVLLLFFLASVCRSIADCLQPVDKDSCFEELSFRSFFRVLKKPRDKKLLPSLGAIVFITAASVVLLVLHQRYFGIPLSVSIGGFLLFLALKTAAYEEEWSAFIMMAAPICLLFLLFGIPCLIWYVDFTKQLLLALGASLLCAIPIFVMHHEGCFYSWILYKIIVLLALLTELCLSLSSYVAN